MRPLLVALAAVLAVAAGRAWVSARAEIEAAEAAEARGAAHEAIEHYQYAMRWYTPLASAPEAGAAGLESIAEAAEARGDVETALMALRRLRGGIRATRWILSPFGDRAEAVDARIAGHMARQQLGQPSAQGRDLEALRAEHLRLLRLDPTPQPLWSLVVTLSFFGWIACAALFIRRGLDAEARLRGREGLPWLIAALATFALWILGLTQA